MIKLLNNYVYRFILDLFVIDLMWEEPQQLEQFEGLHKHCLEWLLILFVDLRTKKRKLLLKNLKNQVDFQVP